MQIRDVVRLRRYRQRGVVVGSVSRDSGAGKKKDD
jgi:hypothetical protein